MKKLSIISFKRFIKRCLGCFSLLLAELMCKLYPSVFEKVKCGICNIKLLPAITGYKPLPSSLYTGAPQFPLFSRGIFPLIYAECPQCHYARINPSPREEWINWVPKMENSGMNMSGWMEDPKYISEKQRSLEEHYKRMNLDSFKTSESSILDVSCGSGVGLAFFRDQLGWKKVAGIECDIQAVRLAQEKRHLDVEYGLINLSRRTETFDLVTMDNALEHHTHPQEALSRARSLLRNGGGLFIIVPNYEGWSVETFGLEYFNMNWGHWHYFNVYSLKTLLDRTGFRLVRAYSAVCESMLYEELGKKIPPMIDTDFAESELKKLDPKNKVFRGDFIHLLAVAE